MANFAYTHHSLASPLLETTEIHVSYEVDFSFSQKGHPDREELVDYFRRGRWYDVEPGGATYADTDTGVVFDIGWEGEEAEIDRVTFRLQTGRPAIYGREAIEEIETFGEAFETSVDVTLADWREANRQAVGERLDAGETGDLYAMEDEVLEEAWRWNRVRRDLQEELGNTIFVPRILFFEDAEGIRRGIVWPDAIPMALPEVDFVLVSAPDQSAESDAPRAHRVEYADLVEATADNAEERTDPVPHLELRWEEAPTDLMAELVSAENVADPDDLTGLACDRIFELSLTQSDRS